MSAKARIFVVDDDAAVRDSLLSLLELEGFEVAAFPDGQSFIDTVSGSTEGLVLLDVRLPDINGLELQQRIAKLNSGLVVIVITGHGDVAMAVDAMKAGAADFIEKPFKGDIVVESIRHALASRMTRASLPRTNAEEQTRLEQLTPREREVLSLLVIGKPNKIIAGELGISPRTVEIHRARVMEKTQAKSLSHLIRMAMSAGFMA